MGDWGALAAELWSFVDYWRSENYMAKVIAKIHPDEQNSRVFTAASNSSACVRQALAYEASATTADTSVRPLLLYYAFLNWMKALLHVTDVEYPSEAAVLQHGVSVRRTKRNSYQLPSEMVYIYKQGVLQSAASQTRLKLPQRILLGDILGMLPPIQHLIREFYPKFQHLYPIQAEEIDSGLSSNSVLVPRTIAANNGQTIEEWLHDLLREYQRQAPPTSLKTYNVERSNAERNSTERNGTDRNSADGDNTDRNNSTLSLQDQWEVASFIDSARRSPAGYLRLPRSVTQHPWVIQQEHQPIHLVGAPAALPLLHKEKVHVAHKVPIHDDGTNSELLLSNRAPLAGWVTHFIVLYCLSSLVRYNPLEWSDILRWYNEPDALIVDAYLQDAPTYMRVSLAGLFEAMMTHSSPALSK